MAKAMTLTEKSSEFDLPKELSNPTVNMESCILFGLPKCGKTTLLSKLPNCLIITLKMEPIRLKHWLRRFQMTEVL